MRMRASLIAVVGAVAVAAAAMSWTVSRNDSANAATINPGDFVRHVTNPYFPLTPGTLLVYRGIKDGKRQTDRVFVTHRTKIILGVRTTVVRDVARHGRRVLESTKDWFAQDKKGNVWYMGEDTRAFENGHVDTEGSWQAGVKGARPGIVMEADPHASDGYRQEFWRGHAEDQAWVLARGGHVRVPYGRLGHKLVTLEWTPLEPKVVDKKIYARGFGIVREIGLTGAKETAELVRVHRP